MAEKKLNKTKTDSSENIKSAPNQSGLKGLYHQITSGPFLDIRIGKNIWIIAIIFSLIMAIFYLLTTPQNNAAYAFSDEFLATAYNLGLSRAPGQPIYTLLLHFILNLPLPTSIVMRGHFLSILLGSGALIFTFLSIWLLIAAAQKSLIKSLIIFSQEIDRLVVSAFATISMGSTFWIWEYANIAEKPAFISLLISIIVFLSLKLLLNRTVSKAIWYWLIAIYAIGIGNYPPMIFLLPLLIVVGIDFFNRNQQSDLKWKSLGLGLAIILGNLLLIIVLSFSKSPVSWDLKPTFSGLWTYFTNNDFDQNALLAQFGQKTTETIPIYIQNMVDNFGFILLFLILIGLRMIIYLPKKISLAILGLIISQNIIYPLLLSWSASRFVQIQILRQYAMVAIPFALFIGLGIWVLLGRLSKAFQILSSKNNIWKISVFTILLIFITLRLYQGKQNFSKSTATVYHQLHTDTLKSLPAESLLVCTEDIDCNTFLYLQTIEKQRKDIFILTSNYPLVKKNLESHQLRRFTYDRNPVITHDYISWNIDKRPVFISGLNQLYVDILGMDYGFTYYIPSSYYGQLTREMPSKLPANNYDISLQLKNIPTASINLMQQLIKEDIAQLHVFNALIYEKIGFRDLARENLNIATNLAYQIPDISKKKFDSSRLNVESMSPVSNWALGTGRQNVSDILIQANDFITKDKFNNAYKGIWGAVTLEPDNIQARLELAQLYEKMSDSKSAIMEYRHVLVLDPENDQAQQKINTLAN